MVNGALMGGWDVGVLQVGQSDGEDEVVVVDTHVVLMVALNVRDPARFECMFASEPSVVDPPIEPPLPPADPTMVIAAHLED